MPIPRKKTVTLQPRRGYSGGRSPLEHERYELFRTLIGKKPRTAAPQLARHVPVRAQKKR